MPPVARLNERNLYFVLSIMVALTGIFSGLMIMMTSGTGDAASVARAAVERPGFGSDVIGSFVFGFLAANLLVWSVVLMLGAVKCARRSLASSAKPSMELSVS